MLSERAVAGVPVADENVFDSVSLETFAGVEGDTDESVGSEAQRALPLHPVLGDADRNGRRHKDLGIQPQSGLLGDVQGAGRVVLHGQVLVVLLGASGWQDGTFEVSVAQTLACASASTTSLHLFSRERLLSIDSCPGRGSIMRRNDAPVNVDDSLRAGEAA